MRNPYIKIAGIILPVEGVIVVATLLHNAKHPDVAIFIFSFLINAPLLFFLVACVYRTAIEKWEFIQKKELSEWVDEIESEYNERRKILEELRTK